MPLGAPRDVLGLPQSPFSLAQTGAGRMAAVRAVLLCRDHLPPNTSAQEEGVNMDPILLGSSWSWVPPSSLLVPPGDLAQAVCSPPRQPISKVVEELIDLSGVL